MSDPTTHPPKLEPRFHQPENWRWHSFKNPQGRTLRFGTVAPKDRPPEAIVIGLQGLSEFTEKYFETARTLLDHNLGFWMMDWQGQGKSDRPLKNPHKRHSNSFDDDVDDLHYFLMEYVKHAAVHTDVGRIPLVMLGHSMGANIGLRFLDRYPNIFTAAAFSAPLVNINALKNLPSWLRFGATRAMREFLNHTYVFGGGNWHPEIRGEHGRALLSSDPVRNRVQDEWCLHDPALQVGGVTFGWVAAAETSCARLQKSKTLRTLDIPFLFGLAENEHLVDNEATRRLAKTIKNARLLDLRESRHEILMERDGIRNAFFEALFRLLQENNIKEKLKPF